MNGRFAAYYWSVVVKPARTFDRLLRDNDFLRFSFYAVSITAFIYTLVYVFLIFGGGQPFTPWLDIPLDVYYKYNVFFCAPSMFLGWILAAGVVHSLSRLLTSTGTFEQTLCVFGFGISVASWTTGIHDLLTSFLGAIHTIDQRSYEVALNSPTIWRTLLWIQMGAYLVWFTVLFSKGTRAVYAIKTGQSLLFGIIGFLTYQFFFFIFNR